MPGAIVCKHGHVRENPLGPVRVVLRVPGVHLFHQHLHLVPEGRPGDGRLEHLVRLRPEEGETPTERAAARAAGTAAGESARQVRVDHLRAGHRRAEAVRARCAPRDGEQGSRHI
eukprot:1063555-Prorocentrum_minimum.AAC.1